MNLINLVSVIMAFTGLLGLFVFWRPLTAFVTLTIVSSFELLRGYRRGVKASS